MSLYGYPRATTPNLDRLAREGAVFESAYSNSSWTRPSTLSFLTSLQHSALGGLRNGRNAPPLEVETAAEQLHRAGYQTGFFTTNPNAGTMSDLGRGVDVMRETGVPEERGSSLALHEDFWSWREAYPGEPLAPLLLGDEQWRPRPVILDEFNLDIGQGQRSGQIEIIDGRWGASLYVGPPNPDDWIHLRAHREVPPAGSSFREGVPEETPRLLLYDLWSDPYTQHSVHEEHPELAEKYTRFLEEELRRNRALEQRFTRPDDNGLIPEQLETLRSLGYIH